MMARAANARRWVQYGSPVLSFTDEELEAVRAAYNFLGCSVPATDKDVQRQYFSKIRHYHPDHGGDESVARKVSMLFFM